MKNQKALLIVAKLKSLHQNRLRMMPRKTDITLLIKKTRTHLLPLRPPDIDGDLFSPFGPSSRKIHGDGPIECCHRSDMVGFTRLLLQGALVAIYSSGMLFESGTVLMHGSDQRCLRRGQTGKLILSGSGRRRTRSLNG
jgi:hypothetical protein